jgi:hypothetical protein
MIITIAGVGMIAAGSILLSRGLAEQYDTAWGTFGAFVGGLSIISLGAVATIPGLILISAGSSREKTINLFLLKFEGSASLNGIGVTVRF